MEAVLTLKIIAIKGPKQVVTPNIYNTPLLTEKSLQRTKEPLKILKASKKIQKYPKNGISQNIPMPN